MPILLGMGLDELSMAPQAIPDVKDRIRKLSRKNSVGIVDNVLKQSTVADIERIIMGEVNKLSL